MDTEAHPLAPAPSVRTGTAVAPVAPAGLTYADGRFLRNGRTHRILAGSLHYFRVHPEQWPDRLQRLVDLGLNTVDTYIPWNFHRPRLSDAADFSGWRDIGAFVECADRAGLDVVLRPGPYICAEWSNGGLPAWLTARRVALRSSDPAFREPVEEWFGELLPRLTPYQAAFGGPVVAFQVENEFGSYGDDSDYVRWVDDLLVRFGVTELRYSADGPTDVMLDGGSVPGILTATTLGSKPAHARELLRSRRDGEPFFVAEFWNGWFDHWGHPHHVRAADDAAGTVAEIVSDGGSVSIYMAHGGSNFGLWAGANDVDGELRPTVTSYDSDAPIAEDGRSTAKSAAMRESFGAVGARAGEVEMLGERSVEMARGASLAASLARLATGAPVSSSAARSFEELGADAGLVAYRADVLLPDREVALNFERVADRALVFVDGAEVGTVTASGSLQVRGRGRPARLDVVVENLGRINYGHRLGEHKGLLGAVLVERRRVQGWQSTPIELDLVDAGALAELADRPADGDAAGISWATFALDVALDTHLALPGFDKGFVWVNGFLLGRYWSIGPQQTLYLPAPLLRAGDNTVVVLELHRSGDRLDLRRDPELGPTETYIEEF